MRLEFEPGTVIFKQNDRSDRAFLILSGKVDILYEADGQESIVTTLEEGQIFGEMGLVDEAPRSATARAQTQTIVEAVDQDGFIEKLTQNPQECLKYLHVLFERLRNTNARLTLEKNNEAALLPGQHFHIILKPLTQATQKLIPEDAIMITHFPFRIGRQSKHSLETNDLQIADEQPFQVSRHHLCIERDDKHVVVRDRGSFKGTCVNDHKIGGKARADSVVLQPGANSITLGGHDSPYQFTAELHFSKTNTL